MKPDDVGMLINLHLYFGHCGNSKLFPGGPFVAQRTEFELSATGIHHSRLGEFQGGLSMSPIRSHRGPICSALSDHNIAH